MIRDGVYSGKTRDGQWYVMREDVSADRQGIGTTIKEKQGRIMGGSVYSPSSSIDGRWATAATKSKPFIAKLAGGDFGLAKTYWLFLVLVGIVVKLAGAALEGTASPFIFFTLILAHTIYVMPVLVGTWHAANRYGGPKIWGVLAQVAVVAGWVMVAFTLFGLASMLPSLIP